MDELAQWLNASPLVKTALVVGGVGCFWAFVDYMRERDMRLLNKSGPGESASRSAAPAKGVGESSGTRRTTK